MRHICTIPVEETIGDTQLYNSSYRPSTTQLAKKFEAAMAVIYTVVEDDILNNKPEEPDDAPYGEMIVVPYPIIGVPFCCGETERNNTDNYFGKDEKELLSDMSAVNQNQLIDQLYGMRMADLSTQSDPQGLGDKHLFNAYTEVNWDALQTGDADLYDRLIDEFKTKHLPRFDEVFISYMTYMVPAWGHTEPVGEFDYVLSIIASRVKANPTHGYGQGLCEQFLRCYALDKHEKSMLDLFLPDERHL